MNARDKYGLIVQDQSRGILDGGDTVNWEGHRVYLTDGVGTPLSLFETGKGGYCRHFDPDMTYKGFGSYYQNPWDGVISKDQLTGIIAWIIKTKDYRAAVSLLLHHFCWLFLFAYNTRANGEDPETTSWKIPDPTLFETWCIEFRMIPWVFYPLAWISDLYLILRVLLFNLQGSSDPISFTMRIFICIENMPTLWSYLAWKILNKNKLLKALENYWCGWRQHPTMFEYYKRKIEMLSK